VGGIGPAGVGEHLLARHAVAEIGVAVLGERKGLRARTDAAGNVVSIHDLSAAQVAGLFRLAADVKANPAKYENHMHRRPWA
jgi:hypothetical protein